MYTPPLLSASAVTVVGLAASRYISAALHVAFIHVHHQASGAKPHNILDLCTHLAVIPIDVVTPYVCSNVGLCNAQQAIPLHSPALDHCVGVPTIGSQCMEPQIQGTTKDTHCSTSAVYLA